MNHRLAPAGLFAAAAALYWVVALGVLRVAGAFQFQFEFPADDGCGGSCTIYVSVAEALGLMVASAAVAAFVAAALGPRLAERFDDRPESVWWAGIWITVGAYVLGYVGVLVALGLSTGDIGFVRPEALVGVLIASPVAMTAVPFGVGAAWLWARARSTEPTAGGRHTAGCDPDGERLA